MGGTRRLSYRLPTSWSARSSRSAGAPRSSAAFPARDIGAVADLGCLGARQPRLARDHDDAEGRRRDRAPTPQQARRHPGLDRGGDRRLTFPHSGATSAEFPRTLGRNRPQRRSRRPVLIAAPTVCSRPTPPFIAADARPLHHPAPCKSQTLCHVGSDESQRRTSVCPPPPRMRRA